MSDWRANLEAGYKSFRSGEYAEQKALYETLGSGQSPKVFLIGCADSRVDPTDIFNAKPGEIFVARNVANVVPPHEWGDTYDATSAALEYAVTVLKVDVILVMGHASCGGVAGCLAGMGDDPGDSYVGAWVSLLNGARDRVVEAVANESDRQLALEHEGIRNSLNNLMSYPFVKAAVDAGDLDLQGAHFSIGDATLTFMDATGDFVAV